MNNSTLNEQIVSVSNQGFTLEGTLTLPDSDSIEQSVLLVQDSGPLDRNQNSAQIQQNVLSAIAIELAANNIASLRFDKRGCGASKGNHDAAGHSDLVADAQTWLNFLHIESPVKHTSLFVLGHGEGSLIASQLIHANDFLKGQILISPFLENYEAVIRRQTEDALKEIDEMEGFKGKFIRFFLRISGDQLAKQRKLIKRIQRSRKSVMKIRKQRINAKWIREMVAMDPKEIYSRAKVPTLIIGGEKDLQSRPEDAYELDEMLNGPTQTHVFSDLTHILRQDFEKPSIQHYLILSVQDVDVRVLTTISDWLRKQ